MSTVHTERGAKIQRVLLMTLLANSAIVLAKVMAGLSAHSLSVLADAAHSSVDALSNCIALALARVAAQGPDAEHPYGHAKFETLGGLAIVAFLSIAVYELVKSALGRLLGAGASPMVTPLAVGTMIISGVVSLLIWRYEDRYGRRYHSPLLIADAAHTKSDFYSSTAVLAGMGVMAVGFPQADALVTLLVAVMIARVGFGIVQSTVPVLVDQRAVEVDTICRLALATPGVIDCFAVRSRGSQGDIFAELTITVAPELNVADAHLIADAVERGLAAELSAREIVVHVEPHQSG
jgi:cation diffusion facilitator family transporter